MQMFLCVIFSLITFEVYHSVVTDFEFGTAKCRDQARPLSRCSLAFHGWTGHTIYGTFLITSTLNIGLYSCIIE